MLKKEIADALTALKEIKMPKIEDKELRSALIANHFTLLDAGRKVDAQVEDKRTVFTEAYKEEAQVIQDLQNKFNESEDAEERKSIAKDINSHKDYLKAINDFNEEVNKLYAEKVPGLKPIDHEKFMAEAEKMDNFKLSWVEALYPMFVLE
jgi:predicted nuclease with TOPRIM domain